MGCQPTPTPTAQPAPTKSAPTPVPPTPVPPTPTKVPVKVTVWVIDRIGQPGMAEAKKVCEQWAKETGNQVEVTENAFFEMLGKIPAAFPAGNGPDLVMLTNNYIGQFSPGGLLAPIDEALPPAERSKYTKGAIDSFTLDGKLWGVPLAADVNALLYNKKLLPEPPKTMDELIAKSKELKKGGNFGLLFTVDQFWFDYPFFSGYGGYVFKHTDKGWDVNDLGFANEGAVKGLKLAYDLVHVHGLMPADVTWDVMNSMFSEGKAAMIINNPTMIAAYTKAGVDVGVARIPQLDNGKYPRPFATYTGVCVNGHSKNQKQASELAVYLGSHLSVPLFKANPGNIPVYSEALSSPELAKDATLAAWMSQLEESDPLPSITEMNQVWQPAATAFQTVVSGKAKAEDALKACQEQIAEAIKKAKQ